MPPYDWIHLENTWWVFGGGFIITLAIILARSSAVMSFSMRKQTEEALENETHHFAGIVSEQNRPVPVFIWLVGIGFLAWAVGYTIFSGKHGL
ncbi:MAG: hypothetical protein QNJ97_25455 [Myxococcota bacterium]|nr:hypothetical protein [Myxococcota bacterium]